MGLKSGNLRGWNSSFEDDICDRTTSGDTRRFRRKLKAPHAMVESKREADRAARRALAGPCTTEYGPCMAGNRKIVRTAKTATTASSYPMRPGIIDVRTVYRRNSNVAAGTTLTPVSTGDAVPRCKAAKTKPCSLLNRAPATRICKRVLRPVALRQEGIISAGVFDLGRLPELRIVFHEPLRGANSFPFQ